MFRTSTFYQLLDTATSHLNLDPDWPTILQICDLIRQGDIAPKVALAAIKKKITNSNPHIALFGLLVLESCVKNCGNLIHEEIGTKLYMEQLTELIKSTPHEDVKVKTLELIQAWAFAFRNSSKYTAIKDTLNILKAQEYVFPELKESDAMFSADTAPEWTNSDECNRCRTVFSLVQRKHHCRACGQVFCGQCSSKTSTLPRFGIEKMVRVCDACYMQLNKSNSTAPIKESELPVEYLSSSLAQQQQVPPRKTADELKEEEELNLALALSQSEADQKEHEKKRITSTFNSNAISLSRSNYSPSLSQSTSPSKIHEGEAINPELAKYLNRQYWEERSAGIDHVASKSEVASPSAPNISSPMPQRMIVTKQRNGRMDNKLDEFVTTLRSQVELFVNRMKSNSSRGRSIIDDSFFQGLFMNITTMHSQLLKYIQDHDDTRVNYEGLQDKITQVKDARDALDVLREEHQEKLRREAEEAERQKQMLMAMKLDIMRKKKQEYLNYQRQLALQKIQERERELQMRQEQQKQQYITGGYQYASNFMGSTSQDSPIRHPHYHPPNTNYNSMSPTNQGIYVYGPSPINTFTQMQNYGMPLLTSVPPNTITNLSNNQEHSLTPQPTGSETIIQRDNMTPSQQTGMMLQIYNNSSQLQIPNVTTHPISLGNQHRPSSGHIGASRLTQPDEVPHSMPPAVANSLQNRLCSNAPPGYMNITQSSSNNVQIPSSAIQQIPQHVSVSNNIATQVPISLPISASRAPQPNSQQIQLSIPVTQPMQYLQPSTAPESSRMDLSQPVEEKKASETTELISFD